jgi:hypothetical protein
MEKQFLRAGKAEAGGPKVISTGLFRSHPLSSDDAVLKNPIAPLKRKPSNFNRRSFYKARARVGPGDRFARRKNSSNTGGTRSLPTLRNNTATDGSVTTSHLLLLNPPGKTVALLPIWLRNSDVLGPRYDQKAERGAGGSAARSQKDASIHKLTRNFILKASPALSLLWKKCAAPWGQNC